MSNASSRQVTSNQTGPHSAVPEWVARSWLTNFRKPIAQHSLEAFALVEAQMAGWSGPLILDSCCGVGESSIRLAKTHPDSLVIGVDKSAHRLAKSASNCGQPIPSNLILVRADLNDFWRLASDAGWRLTAHYLLYPNPWPKKKHAGRRWHGAPVFPFLVRLGGWLHMRSNWPVYLQEMQVALGTLQIDSQITLLGEQVHPLTPFERKYQASGQALWSLSALLENPRLVSREQRDAMRELAESAEDMLKSTACNTGPGESCGA